MGNLNFDEILAEWSKWSVSTCKSQIEARNEQYVIDNSIGNETTTSVPP